MRRYLCAPLCVLVAAAAAVAPWAGLAAEVGTTAGSFEVTAGGAATYTIPITIPPGTAGMQPALALTYSSQGDSWLLGEGFSLSGLSAITRCPAALEPDGFIDGVDFDDNDRYCLDGQRLMTDGSYGAVGAQYSTELESFSKIVSVGGAAHDPGSFVVYTKSGLIMEYGATADSRWKATTVPPTPTTFIRICEPPPDEDVCFNQPVPGHTPPGYDKGHTWAVSKVRDTAGNYYTVTYTENSATGEYVPDTVDYTGNVGLIPYASVKFVYETRPDSTIRYLGGQFIKQTKRLTRIETHMSGAIVRTYTLAYDAAGHVGASRATSVTECADATCLPPTALSWTATRALYGGYGGQIGTATGVSHYVENSTMYGPYDIARTLYGDFNADGLTDIYVVPRSASAASGSIYLRTGGGFSAAQVGAPHLTSSDMSFTGNSWAGQFFTTVSPVMIKTADLNGDGFTDIYEMRPNQASRVHINQKNGTFQLKSGPVHDRGDSAEAHSRYPNRAHLLDMDGGGLADVFAIDGFNGTFNTKIYRNLGDGTFASAPVNGPAVYISGNNDWANVDVKKVKLGDFNGDGLTDAYILDRAGSQAAVVHLQQGNGTFVSKTGPVHAISGSVSYASVDVDRVQVADINGDGLSDVLRVNGSSSWAAVSIWFSRGDGTFDGPVNGPQHYVNTSDSGYAARDVARVKLVDINADGRADIYIVRNLGGSMDQGDVYLSKGSYRQEAGGLALDYETYSGSPHQVSNDSVSAALRGLSRFAFIDLNGDAIPEIYDNRAWGSTDPAWITVADANEGDRIVGITNGLGADISVYYRHLPGWSGYTKGTGSVYPVMEFQGPVAVVSERRTDNGIGGLNTITYAYSGARLHWRGRGMLGFASFTARDAVASVKETTTFRQDFPFIGLASGSVTTLDDGRAVADSSTTYAKQTFGSGAGARHFLFADVEVARSWEVYGVNRVVTSTVTDNEYAEPVQYGNLTGSTVSVYEGAVGASAAFVTVNTNQYWNEPSQWLLGRLTRSTVSRSVPDGASGSRTSAFEYDTSTGLLSAEIIEPDSASLWLRTAYERDGFGNITRTTVSGPDFAQRSTRKVYDSRGRFATSAFNALNHEERYTHDPATGAITSLTGPNNLTTHWFYDAFGRKTREERADNTWTSITRQWCGSGSPACAAGNVLRLVTQTSNGVQGIVEYDVLERPTRSLTLALDGNWVQQLTEHNIRGQVQRKSAPHFLGETAYWTYFSYDLMGRVIQENAPVDQNNPNGNITSFAHDGLTTSSTNGLNQTEQRTLNALGKLREVRDNANGTTQYVYDAFDNLVTTIDPAGNAVVMSYDVRGRKTGMTDPDMGQWSYTYDALGQLKSQTDAKQQVVTMNYDLLGRMTSRAEGAGGAEITTWAYDFRWKGALASVSGPGYQREHYYDALGRPSITDHTIGGGIFSYSHTYDAQGRPLSLTYPSGFWVVHEYNPRGYLNRVSTSASALFNVINCSTASNPEGITFSTCALSNPAATNDIWRLEATDAWGHETSSTLGNGVSTMRSYDLANARLDAILTGAPGQDDIQSLNYTWDRLGNLLTRTDQLQNGLTEQFQYDGLNRLTSAQVLASADPLLREVSVSYDAIGNILSKSNVGSYSYAERPHAVTATAGVRPAVYTYDANGNQTSGAGRIITWTTFNKPSQIVQGANSNTFVYGPDRERIRQDSTQAFVSGSAAVKSTIYVGGLYESEAVSGLPLPVMARHFVQAGGRVVAIHTRPEAPSGPQHGTFQYLHHDHLGSVEVISNQPPPGQPVQIVERFSYDAFGKRRELNWLNDPLDLQLKQPHATDKGYTSQQQLDGVALIHYGGRVYDPILGRFTSADPIVQAPGDTQSYNRYAYVRNNPLAYTDPSGYSWLSKHWRRVTREVRRWESDFRHEIRRPNSLLGPAIVIASAVACGPCSASTTAAVAATTTVAVARAQGVTDAGDLAKAGFIAAWTAGAFNAAGSLSGAPRVVAHGFAGGLSTAVSGGDFGAGFLASAFTASVSSRLAALTRHDRVAGTIAAAVVGGTAAELAGGKFANGAVNAAFAYLFNDWVHRNPAERVSQRALDSDGRLSLMEANEIWRLNNDPNFVVTVDASALSVELIGDFNANGRALAVVTGEDFFVHGTVTLTRDASGDIRILPGEYNFELHGNFSDNLVRNTLTEIGFGLASRGGRQVGVDYLIRYAGSPRVIP